MTEVSNIDLMNQVVQRLEALEVKVDSALTAAYTNYNPLIEQLAELRRKVTVLTPMQRLGLVDVNTPVGRAAFLEVNKPDIPDAGIIYTKNTFEVSGDDGGGWLVIVPELPGCMADGRTEEEALTNADEAIAEWLHDNG